VAAACGGGGGSGGVRQRGGAGKLPGGVAAVAALSLRVRHAPHAHRPVPVPAPAPPTARPPTRPPAAPRVPRILLPRKNPRSHNVSLVLDLDETLVHCSVDPIPDADVTFPVTFAGQSYQVFVRKRPFLDRFLAWVSERFEVTIFTASQQVYAERLLALLDPEGRHITHRLYRDSCLNVDGNYLKDLNVMGRDLGKTVLVDNSPHAFGYQLDNGIPIESWFDDRGDRELLKLVRFLETIQHAADVRPLVREKFKLHKLVAAAR
jgi:CTD small phosphatase-like protein 2